MKWKENLNKKYLVISVYVIIVAAIIFTFEKIAAHFPDIISWIMLRVSWIVNVLKPVFFGFVFAYLTRPVVVFFEKGIGRVKFLRRWARIFSVILTLLLIIIILAAILSALVFSVTSQLRLANFDDIIDAVNQILMGLDEFYKSLAGKIGAVDIGSDQLIAYMEEGSSKVFAVIKDFVAALFSSLTNISSYFSTLLFGIIIGIYFMIDGEVVIQFISRVSKVVFKDKFNIKVREYLHELHTVFSGYIQGQLCDVAFMMAAIGLVLTLTGVKFSAMIGIFAGLANLIPYLGPFVAYSFILLICIVNAQYKTMLISMVLVLIIQVIDGNIIEPKFLSRSIKIHPLLIIIFLIFGNAIGGVLGMLIAVPMGGFCKVVFMKWLAQKEYMKTVRQAGEEVEEEIVKDIQEEV